MLDLYVIVGRNTGKISPAGQRRTDWLEEPAQMALAWTIAGGTVLIVNTIFVNKIWMTILRREDTFAIKFGFNKRLSHRVQSTVMTLQTNSRWCCNLLCRHTGAIRDYTNTTAFNGNLDACFATNLPMTSMSSQKAIRSGCRMPTNTFLRLTRIVNFA